MLAEAAWKSWVGWGTELELGFLLIQFNLLRNALNELSNLLFSLRVYFKGFISVALQPFTQLETNSTDAPQLQTRSPPNKPSMCWKHPRWRLRFPHRTHDRAALETSWVETALSTQNPRPTGAALPALTCQTHASLQSGKTPCTQSPSGRSAPS